MKNQNIQQEKITVQDLEQICKKLDIVRFFNQDEFINNPKGLLIKRIKEYLFDDRDFSMNKYLEKAQNAFHNQNYHAAQMYMDIYIMKAYTNKKLIQNIQYFALKIYEKLSFNEENAKKMLSETIQISKKLNLMEF
ncbi:MAG: hypothetical protein WC393_04435 [Candidatus Nanoarchaeia archaeon]|jgi:hypothetical protein